MKIYLCNIILGLIITLNSCIVGPKQKQSIEYVAMNQFNYKLSKLDSGTSVRIIAFSGGKDNDEEKTYYSQFIAIDENTGDTVRILTAFISVKNNSDANSTYTPPSQFDGNKGVVEATYLPEDTSALKIMKQTLALSDEGKIDKMNQMPSIDEFKARDFVVINNSFSIFQNHNYKTVKGVLHFDVIPW